MLSSIAGELADLRRCYNEMTLLGLLTRSDRNLLSTDITLYDIYDDEDLPENQKHISEYVAIDCEMVGVGPRASRSALGRVSIVNKWGYILLDIFVWPDEPIRNYRTRWSGLSKKVFKKAEQEGTLYTLEGAQQKVEEIIDGRIVIGHSVWNDLDALELDWDPPCVVDTQRFPSYPYFGLNRQAGLKNIMAALFDIKIQDQASGHDSVEDAQATMLLYRALRPCLQQQTQ